MIVGNRFHEDDLGTNIICDLLDLELPEMGSFDLDLPAGHSYDAVLGGFDSFPDFLAFTYINLHGISPSVTSLATVISDIPTGLRGLIPLLYDTKIV